MLTQKLTGTVINGVGAPVSGTITATTFPNSVVSTDLIKKTVIASTVGVDGKFVIYVPKFVECSVKITSGITNVYSTVINVTNDDELDLSVYAADPPPNIADPFTLHMQDMAIHNPALGRSEIYVNAGETISGSRVVRVSGGFAMAADSSNASYTNSVVGIAVNAANIGEVVQIRTSGEFTDTALMLTSGQPVYFDDLGRMTNTPPSSGFIQRVGIAVTSTRLLVAINQPIQL